jgi:hypothetical protein
MESTPLISVGAQGYARLGVPADQLPYTKEFEELYAEFIRLTSTSPTRAEFWRLLANARKRGRLPRLKR